MRALFLGFVLGGAAGGAAGCGTAMTSRDTWPHPTPYSGVRRDWTLISHPTEGPCGTGTAGIVAGLTDLPFSMAADTIILPFTLLPAPDAPAADAGEESGTSESASSPERV